MDLVRSPESGGNSVLGMDGVAAVVASVRRKGVRLWTENGQLHYRGPKGLLSEQEIDELRTSKGKIVALLERNAGSETDGSRSGADWMLARAPATFSQLTHWNLYQLSERRAIRQVATATRLSGRLDCRALRASIAEVVRRHDALRTRMVVLDGVPVQDVGSYADFELELVGLDALSEASKEAELERQIIRFILDPIDVSVGPLFGVKLIRICKDEHVLIVAMEHMISDMFSMNIFLRDLFTGYMQAVKGGSFLLPPVPTQLSEYAAWQASSHRAWAERHGAYWNERLKGCERLRFPVDESVTTPRLGWAKVSFRIDRDMKQQLVDWCRLRRTTLVMCLFTAYVAVVLRWCNAPDAVVQYQSNGRVPDTENTIGYFASALCLRITLLEQDSFLDLLDRVTEEYCGAHEHADSSYLSAQMPRPEFTRNTVFNWIPTEPGVDFSMLEGSEYAIKCSMVPFEHPMLATLESDVEPFIGLFDGGEEIIGEVCYPAGRFSSHEIERFVSNFQLFLGVMQDRSQLRVKDICLL